jgi:hypothetical protein
VLDHIFLRDRLREFGDPTHVDFRGFPTTRARARHEWAVAFANYVDLATEEGTGLPAGHPTMDMGSVRADFEEELDLSRSLSAATAAADFAGAWRSSIMSVSSRGEIEETTTGTFYTFVSFTNVPAQHAVLLARLTALFSRPAVAMVPRLEAIAAEFHAATDGLIASIRKRTSSGTIILEVGLA